MKKYRVGMYYSATIYFEVEASSEEEAKEKVGYTHDLEPDGASYFKIHENHINFIDELDSK